MSTHQDKSPIVAIRSQLAKMEGEFKTMLPEHIAPDKFNRVVLTALQRSPQLLNMDRKSLFESCLACAGDGLLPDGKEAALVPYKGKVQYLPMIAGIRKKVRQAGDIVSWEARIVRENDEFELVYGDDEHITHRPTLTGDAGDIIGCYSIALFKSGEKSREFMSIGEIEAIRRKSSGAGNGPWSDQAFYPEMVRKTVLKRHAKSLPLSADAEAVLRRDDSLYDLHTEAAVSPQLMKYRPSLSDFAGDTDPRAPLGGGQRAEASGAAGGAAVIQSLESPDAADFDESQEPPADPLDAAYERGAADRRAGKSSRALPGEYRAQECKQEAEAWRQGWNDEDQERKTA